jgi:hypothetical protein
MTHKVTCPNCGETFPVESNHHSNRTPKAHRANPSTEPNDRSFAQHLRRVRLIEEKILSAPYHPDLLEDL